MAAYQLTLVGHRLVDPLRVPNPGLDKVELAYNILRRGLNWVSLRPAFSSDVIIETIRKHVGGIDVLSGDTLSAYRKAVVQALFWARVNFVDVKRFRLASGVLWKWLHLFKIGAADFATVTDLFRILGISPLRRRAIECGEFQGMESLTTSINDPGKGFTGPLFVHAVYALVNPTLRATQIAIVRASQIAGVFSAPEFGWWSLTVQTPLHYAFDQLYATPLTADQMLFPKPTWYTDVAYSASFPSSSSPRTSSFLAHFGARRRAFESDAILTTLCNSLALHVQTMQRVRVVDFVECLGLPELANIAASFLDPPNGDSWQQILDSIPIALQSRRATSDFYSRSASPVEIEENDLEYTKDTRQTEKLAARYQCALQLQLKPNGLSSPLGLPTPNGVSSPLYLLKDGAGWSDGDDADDLYP